MRLHNPLFKISLVTILLITILNIQHQYSFQKALSSHSITFADFPPSYITTLNNSRTNGEPLLSFPYNTTFPAPQIPRIIHFIYFAGSYQRPDGTPSLPPEALSHAPSLCQKYNPSWDIRIWNASTAESLLEDFYPWFLPTYKHYQQPIQRIDALKYFVLYHYGGIYMDLDIACRRPLEPLLGFPAWFPEASPLGVNNDLMATRPRHPLLGEMTRALVQRDWDFGVPYLTVFWSTGPQFASDMVRGWWGRHGNGMSSSADAAGFRVLPRIFYSEEYTFFGHSPGGTWHGGDVGVVLWLVDRPWVVLCAFGGSLTLLLGLLSGLKLRRRRCQLIERDAYHEE